MFPLAMTRQVLLRFRAHWPDVELELRTEALGSVVQLVMDGVSDLGVAMHGPMQDEGLARSPVLAVDMVAVCAASHPAGQLQGRLSAEDLAPFVQLVITDRSALTAGWSAGVISRRTWQLADLHTKHQLLLDGFGFGNLPNHMVCDDLEAGRLVRLDVFPPPGTVGLQTVERRDRPPGPAGRWLRDALRLVARPA
jgi:DNA-binding transcriptional LysR family regulator